MNKIFTLFDQYITVLLHGIKYAYKTVSGIKFNPQLFKGRVSVREQIIFMKRLSMMLQSGMPIVYCLRLIAIEKSGSSVSRLATLLFAEVESGRSLSKALASTAHIKSPIVASLVRIGEASGTLPESLEYLTRELKARQEIRRQIISALVYPAIIVIATLGIAVFLITYIFPKITPIFIGLNAELPLSTKLLLGLSQFLTKYGWYCIAATFILFVCWSIIMRQPVVRYQLELMLISLPLVGRFIQYYNVANMCRTLGILLARDVRIIEALDIVANCAPHSIYTKSLHEVGREVVTGQLLSVSLAHYSKLFPTLVIQMINAGEKTGNLPTTLTFLSDMYETDIRDLTKNLTTILEPVLMLTMGLIVGFIAISIITPIYGITQNLHP